MSIIRLDLDNLVKATFVGSLSSNDYDELVQSALTPLDLLYTFAFRYARVIDYDIPTAEGTPINFDSEIFRFTSQHLALSIPTTVLFLGLAAAGTYNEYSKQKKKKNNSSYKFIYDKFQNVTESLEDRDKRIFDMNYYLSLIVREDEELKKKYHYIKINPRTNTLNFKPIESIKVDKVPFLTQVKNKVIKPVWTSLNIASFVYWILWIGMGVFTGNLLGVGIFALPPEVSFGLPILAGLFFPAKKIYNYVRDKIRNKGETKEEKLKQEQDILQTDAAKNVATKLFRRALLRREYDLKKLALLNQLAEYNVGPTNTPLHIDKIAASASHIDKPILSLTKNKIKKAAMMFFSAIGGTYVAMQYGAWIVTDMLNVSFNIAASIPVLNIVGAVLSAITIGYGIYKAYQKYHSLKELEKDATIIELKQNNRLIDLEATLEKLQKSIAAKKEILGIPVASNINIKHNEEQFFNDIHRRGPTKTTQLKKFLKRAFHFTNGFCTGAFLARLFFVKGTALILPVAAVVFSNPITIGIIVGVGLIYGAFKAYEYHLNRKEERAKLLLGQRVERMECLQQQVELAKLERKLLTTQIKHVNSNAQPASAIKQAAPTLVSSKNLFQSQRRARSLSEGDMPQIYTPSPARVG
jgi:hypothetical protein